MTREEIKQISIKNSAVWVNSDPSDAYRAGYCEGATAATPKWISVSEYLPETPTNVLSVNAGNVTPAIHWQGTWFFLSIDKPLKNVTHWMPLPSPPNEQK